MGDRSEKKVTIKDVAQLAGVSAATVSIVLNNKGDCVPENTKERVRQAAKQLNYRPDFTARAMVTGKTNIIGVVIPDISNPFFAELVRNIQVDMAKCNYDIMLCNSEERAENDLKYIRLLTGRNIDGMILAMSAESLREENAEKLKEALQEARVPYLFLDRYCKGKDPKVVADNIESSYQGVKYLLESGHRKIGIITGPLYINSSYNRLKGAKKAMEEYGLELDNELIVEGKYDFESGISGAKTLIEKGVTAIFAFSDLQAYGIYISARNMGVKIPEDLSVIGFDDSIYASVLETPLTTLRQPVKEIANSACDMMLRLIEGKEGETYIRIPADLVIRSSVSKL